LIATVLHVTVAILFFTVPLQAPWRPSNAVVQPPEQVGDTIVFVLGTREERAKGPTVQPSRRDSAPPPTVAARARPDAAPTRPVVAAPAAAAAAAVPPPPIAATVPPAPLAAAAPPDTGSLMPAYDPNANRGAAAAPLAPLAPVAAAPQVGDGRLWVSPRPGLPASVAEALYGDTTGRNSAAIGRLKAMVDSLNQVLDQIQRDNRRPAWVVGGTPDKPAWGLDSQYIHIAGIKIPTPALALLGQFLPQGNYDEGLRARQLQYMREDLMQAAARAQSFQQFRLYVRELRDRKQAERDAEERRRAQDSVKAVP